MTMNGNTEIQRHDPDFIAATEHGGEEECAYQCENAADWLVEVRTYGQERNKAFYTCQSCSVGNRVYAKENDLYKHEVSEEVEIVG